MSRVEFGSLFEFIRNGMSVKQDKSGNGLPISRIETIWNSSIDPERVGYAGLAEDDCEGWLLSPGDILFSHINSVEHIGKCAVYEGVPSKLVHGMNLLCLRCKPDALLPEYAKHLIRSPEFRVKLSNFINKAVNQASVSIGNLKGIKVTVPSILEQRRIAAILDKADALRAKRREALAQLDRLAQSIFVELFGDPTTNPKGWSEKGAGEFFKFRTGKLDANAAEDGGIYPFFTCSRENSSINTYAFDCEALLLAGNNASADYSIKHYVGKFNAYQRTYIINLLDERNSYRYAAFILENKLIELKRASKGSNTKYLTLEILHRMRIPVPPPELQAEFTSKLAQVDLIKKLHLEALSRADSLLASLPCGAFGDEM